MYRTIYQVELMLVKKSGKHFKYDLFTLLSINLKYLFSLEEWSNILQMYLPSTTAQLMNLWCNAKFLFIGRFVK